MEATYIDIGSWPRKVAGDLTFALRFISVFYGLAICAPGLVFAIMVVVDDTLLRQRGTDSALPLQTKLLILVLLCLPTVLALILLGWKYQSTRSRATAFGKTASSIRRDLREFKWRLDRLVGYPRARRLMAGRSLLVLTPTLAVGTIIYAAATNYQFHEHRTSFLMAGLVSAVVAWIAGMRILRPRRREVNAMIRSWALGLGGLILFAGTVWAALIILGTVTRHTNVQGEGGAFFLVYILGCVLSMLAFGKYKKLKAKADAVSHPATRDVRRSDRRRPILLLRSFPDDSLSVAHEMQSRWEDPRVMSLEEAVANHADRYGPLIAVAEPGIGVTGGAARDRFVDEEWRMAVLGWMDEALLVAMVAGWTKGVQWELDQVVQRGHVCKLVIILPDDPRLDMRWRHVCRSFSSTHWHAALVGADVRSALAVCFGQDGQVYIIASQAKSAGHYEAAVETAIYRTLCHD